MPRVALLLIISNRWETTSFNSFQKFKILNRLYSATDKAFLWNCYNYLQEKIKLDSFSLLKTTLLLITQFATQVMNSRLHLISFPFPPPPILHLAKRNHSQIQRNKFIFICHTTKNNYHRFGTRPYHPLPGLLLVSNHFFTFTIYLPKILTSSCFSPQKSLNYFPLPKKRV